MVIKTPLPLSGILTALLFLVACKPGVQQADWPEYLGDAARSHYAPLKAINRDNVSRLRVAWIYHTGDVDTGGRSQIQCNPIEREGVLYGTSPRLKLFALDAATGKPRWTFDPFSNPGMTPQRNVCRGVAYWASPSGKEDRLFYVAGSYLYAIDPKMGSVVAGFGQHGHIDLHEGLDRDVKDLFITATSPGVIYHDLIIIGTRVAEGGAAAPGHVRAYDVRTGQRRWIFHTIPQPGEAGYDSWEDPEAWRTVGGANAWAGMSLDEERGVVYVPTGSATPDFYGGGRRGRDLFSDCILALDAATGKLKWYYQTVHHDLWDRDLPAPPNLVTIHRNGRSLDAVAQVTKTGFVFVLDRDSGRPVFPVEEMPVPDTGALSGEAPWPTQPQPRLPAPFVPQHFSDSDINPLVPPSSQSYVRRMLDTLRTGGPFVVPGIRGHVVFPGFDGGAEWGGAAYDPATGVLYVNANRVPWSLTMVPAVQKARMPPGLRLYQAHCMVCHGADRSGSGDYPSLRHLKGRLGVADIEEILKQGRGMMPSFRQVSPADRDAIISFLLHPEEANRAAPKTASHPSPAGDAPYRMTGYVKLRTPEGYPASRPPWGTLTAINLNSGATLWQVPLGTYPELAGQGIPATGTENYGGAVVTAGGLVFIAATLDGKIRAFDKSTGAVLWEASLPAAGFATPMTYAIGGKQYVVIACGGGKLEQPSSDTYVAFALP